MSLSVDEAAHHFLSCVCDALTEAGRPVCSCHGVVGPPVIGTNCCECETGHVGEATVHFEQMYDADPATLQQVSRVHPCRSSVTVADYTVVVTRCYPTITETGDWPDPADLDEAASGIHDDVCAVWAALSCCGDTPMVIRSVAVDSMPEAGCSALAARVSAVVRCGVNGG